jgi:hypothetical protein
MSGELFGTWDVQIATPVGRLAVTMTFSPTLDGVSGIATGRGEDVTLRDIQTESVDSGERVTWTQQITKPLRLNLVFDVQIRDDRMTGVSRAGRLPSSRVTGSRRPTR